jgi:transposase InsO family protein
MTVTLRAQRTYDHRLKNLVCETGDIQHAIRRGVPRSTARGWLSSPRKEVVTIDVLDSTTEELQNEVLMLRRRIEKLLAVLRLLVAILKVSGFSLANCRLPDGEKKTKLLQAVKRSCGVLPLRTVLRILRISATRYHRWKRSHEACGLSDSSSCPKNFPQKLMPEEVWAINEMATSPEYRHVPTGTLAILAQRIGKVFASPATWYRLIREHGWRRPRLRVHPSKPKIGIQASKPNEIWHIDTTVIRLLDNTKAYIHAVIDNFSRKILAWKVSDRFETGNTVAILLEAARHILPSSAPPTVMADSGVENVNGKVDELIESGLLNRILAMTEISFSNSLIEAWWRTLKHQWLYLNSLDTVSAIKRLVEFYVEEHNTQLPHSAFKGQTPDERYHGTGDHIPKELEAAREEARQARFDANRAFSCGICERMMSKIPEDSNTTILV